MKRRLVSKLKFKFDIYTYKFTYIFQTIKHVLKKRDWEQTVPLAFVPVLLGSLLKSATHIYGSTAAAEDYKALASC